MTRSILALIIIFLCAPAQAAVFYISTYSGDGSEENPFKAAGVDTGATCRSIRASETLATGFALCSHPTTVPVQAGVFQVSLASPITAAQRTIIGTALGRTIISTTLGDLVFELADAFHLPVSTGNDGLQHILIRGIDISRPAPLASRLKDAWYAALKFVDDAFSVPSAWASSASENWNCADSASLSCVLSWTNFQGAVLALVSNRADTTNSTSVQLSRSSTGASTDDMQVCTTVANINRGTATEINGGVFARQPIGTNTQTYVYAVLRDATTDQVEFGHVVAGSRTADGTTNVTATNGDSLCLQVVNDVNVVMQNGAIVFGPFTEATGNGNTGGGIRFAGTGTGTTTNVALDDWSITDVSPEGPTRRRGL